MNVVQSGDILVELVIGDRRDIADLRAVPISEMMISSHDKRLGMVVLCVYLHPNHNATREYSERCSASVGLNNAGQSCIGGRLPIDPDAGCAECWAFLGPSEFAGFQMSALRRRQSIAVCDVFCHNKVYVNTSTF